MVDDTASGACPPASEDSHDSKNPSRAAGPPSAPGNMSDSGGEWHADIGPWGPPALDPSLSARRTEPGAATRASPIPDPIGPEHFDAAHFDEPGHFDHGHFDQGPHFDQGFFDFGHLDEGHLDEAHFDAHHHDQGHLDEPHIDQPHIDHFHGDTLHDDHGDHAHFDFGHFDVPHFDYGHYDQGHFDEFHFDHHLDFHHSDVVHGDAHYDHDDHADHHDHADHSDEPFQDFADEEFADTHRDGGALRDPWSLFQQQQQLAQRLAALERVMKQILDHLRAKGPSGPEGSK